MNILLILGGVFLAVVVGIICIISLLPSPTINQLLRRYGKGRPAAGQPPSTPR